MVLPDKAGWNWQVFPALLYEVDMNTKVGYGFIWLIFTIPAIIIVFYEISWSNTSQFRPVSTAIAIEYRLLRFYSEKSDMEKTNYGNWVTKKIIIVSGVVAIFFAGISFISYFFLAGTIIFIIESFKIRKLKPL